MFSDTPQGVQEEWLSKNYPALWAQGVRSVTTTTWTIPNILPAAAGDKGTPGALVAYVGGVKYEGTVDLPLRFQPAVTDGSTFSSANTDANIAIAKNPSSSAAGIDFGRSSYSIGITTHDIAAADGADKGMQDYPTTVKISCDGFNVIGTLREFKTKDEAIAYVMGGVTPNGVADARVINPGEISRINLIDRVSNTETHFSTFDPRTGGWISTD